MATRQVGEHRRKRLQNARIIPHGCINAGQDQGDKCAARVNASRQLIRGIDQADLSLGGETGKDVFHVGERRPQLRELPYRATQHLHQGIGPLNKGGGGNQRGGQHATHRDGRHLPIITQSSDPGLEQGCERDAAVPDASTDQSLDTHLKRDARVCARLQGVHGRRQRSHRRRRICAGVAVRAIPPVQVVKEGREPGSFLSPRPTCRNDHRCIQFHGSPFTTLNCPHRARCVRPDTTKSSCELLTAHIIRYSVMVAFGSSTEGCVSPRPRGAKD